jgi:trimeric autotransporter adhesin
VSYTLGDNIERLTLTGTNDIMGIGNQLANTLVGNTGNNYLYGLTGNDIINGGAGNDILQGGADDDNLNGATGNSLLDGGSGTDRLTGGSDNDLLIGSQGNDIMTTGTGFDVISFNLGDGQDIVNASNGADNTISLGGNVAYSDLSLTKTGNNLIVKIGSTDQINLSNWYSTTSDNKSVINLQVIAEAMQDFNLGGSDVLRDNKIETFDFAGLVAQFDAEGAQANWQLTDARLTAHLQSGSDTEAIGGDLAYQYGINSSLTGMGLNNAQSVISAANFGQSAQALNDPSVWQAEVVKLA